jgi:hypothetical protein
LDAHGFSLVSEGKSLVCGVVSFAQCAPAFYTRLCPDGAGLAGALLVCLLLAAYWPLRLLAMLYRLRQAFTLSMAKKNRKCEVFADQVLLAVASAGLFWRLAGV